MSVLEEIAVPPSLRQRMHELLEVLDTQQGNRRGKQWSSSDFICLICKRKRHSCKWAVKGTRKSDMSVLTGRWCYCCIRACLKLEVTKYYQVLVALPELLELVRQKSAELARELRKYDGDTCFCNVCSPSVVQQEIPEAAENKKPPVKRLRSKTTPQSHVTIPQKAMRRFCTTGACGGDGKSCQDALGVDFAASCSTSGLSA